MTRQPQRSTLFPYTTLFRSCHAQEQRNAAQNVYRSVEHDQKTGLTTFGQLDRKSGSAGMPRPISYAVFCLKKKIMHMPRRFLATGFALSLNNSYALCVIVI